MYRNVKSIVEGIAVGIFDKGFIHDACSSLTFAEGLSAALPPLKQRPCPLMNHCSVYHLPAAHTHPLRIYVSKYPNSGGRRSVECNVVYATAIKAAA